MKFNYSLRSVFPFLFLSPNGYQKPTINKNLLKLCGIALLSAAEIAHAQVATTPFKFEGKHIFVNIKANGNDSLNFVFDTGATGASIDSVSAEKMGIGKENRETVQVAGSGGAQTYTIASGQTFKIAGLDVKEVKPVLINFKSFTVATGVYLDGIIGYEILNTYVTQIDFDRKKLLFYNGINEADTTGYTGIPFEFSKGIMIPRFPVSIQLKSGETFTGKVMFDSGAAFSLLISTSFNKFHKISEKLPNKIVAQGRGLNAANNEERAIINSMNFNGFSFGEMAVGLTINDLAQPKDGYLGIIGMDLIKRFNVIIDYANKKIYLKPNQLYNEPFDKKLQSVAHSKSDSLKLLNLAISKAFLEKNKSSKGVIVTPSGLQYKIIKNGKGMIPKFTDKVRLNYVLKYINGMPYSSTSMNGPWEHHIDKALPGMQEAITKMPVGSKWILYLPSHIAFGDEGTEDVPPGSALICEIELLKIVD